MPIYITHLVCCVAHKVERGASVQECLENAPIASVNGEFDVRFAGDVPGMIGCVLCRRGQQSSNLAEVTRCDGPPELAAHILLFLMISLPAAVCRLVHALAFDCQCACTRRSHGERLAGRVLLFLELPAAAVRRLHALAFDFQCPCWCRSRGELVAGRVILLFLSRRPAVRRLRDAQAVYFP